MGSKGGAPSASPSPKSVVCCMCGDRGLSPELFRCKVCLVRSQHKYCSDLYPKAEIYRSCNWCLREEGGKSLPREATTDHNSNTISPSNNNKNNGNSSNSGGSLGVKLQRGTFPLHLNKPIKKQRLPERSPPSEAIERTASEELSPSPSLGRTRQVLIRGKVRRYKLLEEVSS